MKIKWFGFVATLFVCLVLTGVTQAGETFGADLSGDQEVPPIFSETTGTMQIVFDDDETTAGFELAINGGVRITQAHLHCGPSDGNGPVVGFLAGFHEAGWDIDGVWISNATLTDDNILPTNGQGDCASIILDVHGLADAIRAGNIYVNVHSIANPSGEVRGHVAETDDEDDGEKVCICHIPPGNPSNAHTICIDAASVDDHLGHGDTEEACEEDDDGEDEEQPRGRSRRSKRAL